MDLLKVKNELQKEYKYRIEAHAHTAPASTCSEVSVSDVINAYSELGFDALVLTNHFIYGYNYMKDNSVEDGIKRYLNDYNEAVELGKKNNLKVFLGAEIRFTENSNDYLIYGVNEKMLAEIYDFLPNGVENFRKNYAMPHSVFLQAHPFRDGMKDIDPNLLDGMETFNMHPGHTARNSVSICMPKSIMWIFGSPDRIFTLRAEGACVCQQY